MSAERRPITVHGAAEHPRYAEACGVALGPLPGNAVATVTFPWATGPYTVHVAVRVADRDTGEPRWFGFTRETSDQCPVFGGVYACLSKAFNHELDENIYSRGERVFDPHAGDEVAEPVGAETSAQRGSGAL